MIWRWAMRVIDWTDQHTVGGEPPPLWAVVVADLGVRLLLGAMLLVWLTAIGYVLGLGPDPIPPALRDPCVVRGARVCAPDGTWAQP